LHPLESAALSRRIPLTDIRTHFASAGLTHYDACQPVATKLIAIEQGAVLMETSA
jgi:hypothetical protein